jgi:hypothetical protein
MMIVSDASIAPTAAHMTMIWRECRRQLPTFSPRWKESEASSRCCESATSMPTPRCRRLRRHRGPGIRLRDPLAALAVMTEEELIALFS